MNKKELTKHIQYIRREAVGLLAEHEIEVLGEVDYFSQQVDVMLGFLLEYIENDVQRTDE